MARIRKHRNKWQVLFRDPTGKERSAGVYSTRVVADRKRRQVETDIDRGEWFDPTAGRLTTVGDFAPVWIQGRVDLKPSTKAGYEQILSARILPRYADVPVSALTHAELQAWVASMVDEGLSANRVRNVFNTFSGLLGSAVAHRFIRSNPAAGVSLPKAQRDEQRYLAPDEITLVANEVKDRYRAMILTLGVAGLRIGEAAALRRRAIDVIGQRIHVFEAVAKVQSPGTAARWVTSTPKSGKDRHVAIPRHLALKLNEHLIGFPGDPDALVFTTSTGNRVTSAYFSNHILKPALRRAELDARLRTHDLRHSAAAAMIRANPNPELVKRQLGHSSIQVTFDLYGHLFPDEADRLADALDDVWYASHADQMRTKPANRVTSITP
ncbi:MAG: site-specific integrase [Actinobacteria bacterium]|nr:site-specific integrase [Actinomycetota bacterium]